MKSYPYNSKQDRLWFLLMRAAVASSDRATWRFTLHTPRRKQPRHGALRQANNTCHQWTPVLGLCVLRSQRNVRRKDSVKYTPPGVVVVVLQVRCKLPVAHFVARFKLAVLLARLLNLHRETPHSCQRGGPQKRRRLRPTHRVVGQVNEAVVQRPQCKLLA